MLRRLLPALVVALALLAVPAVAQETVTVKPPERFATKIDRINARAKGPVLLPSRMTVEATRLYTSGGTTRGGWDLELAAAPDCGGANACFVATFTAEAGGAPPDGAASRCPTGAPAGSRRPAAARPARRPRSSGASAARSSRSRRVSAPRAPSAAS